MANWRFQRWMPKVLPVVTFLVGAFLGPGFLWQWRHSDIERQQHELETIAKTTDLRKLEIEQFATIVQLTGEYIKAKEEYTKVRSQAGYIKLSQLDTNLRIAVENLL